MAPLSIELSDVGIIAAGGAPAEILPVDGRSTASPGFALQDGHRLMVGRTAAEQALSLIHISEPTRQDTRSRMPSSA